MDENKTLAELGDEKEYELRDQFGHAGYLLILELLVYREFANLNLLMITRLLLLTQRKSKKNKYPAVVVAALVLWLRTSEAKDWTAGRLFEWYQMEQQEILRNRAEHMILIQKWRKFGREAMQKDPEEEGQQHG